MAPPKLRGTLNIMFQLAITVGILMANLINYGTNNMKGDIGWRVSLGLAAVPAIIMIVGSIFLLDTPNSLIERGKNDIARAMLQKIRGTTDVGEEFNDLIEASEASQKLTGINVIMFYAPVLFRTIGFGSDASLMSSVISGLVNMVATLVSVWTVDKVGRRFLFLEGGLQMFGSQIVVAALIAVNFGLTGQGTFSKTYADLVVFFICIYVSAFAWSWGPLCWLVPSEIFPLEIRSAGQSINVSVNLLFTFIIAQVFLSMLWHMKFGLFFFFAAFVGLMTAFIYYFLLETKNIPIEEMEEVWKDHKFWGKVIRDEDEKDIEMS
ncbi:hypothetical protein AMTRI_Chr12g238550 [Amborella trichopoda]|uniref:Major facilitator superfamily (MFS) profile domain-containing protein n=1 Tax=Amborella trichopoda TaxID=13333 RepID=U5D7Q7_AMBTC|nr:hypothetical protein AMTR_s00065p00017520 [Amborella trichopoda]